jgi:hypothetical protein
LKPPVSRLGIEWNEIGGSMKYGIFNLGFFGVSNTAEGREILNWWNTRLIDFCVARPEEGVFTDQKWFDNVPVYFPSCQILRNPGYNVGPWNVEERVISIKNEKYLSNGVEISFFHFSSFDTPDLLGMLREFDPTRLSLGLLSIYDQKNLKWKHLLDKFNSFSTKKEETSQVVKNSRFPRAKSFILHQLLPYGLSKKLVELKRFLSS